VLIDQSPDAIAVIERRLGIVAESVVTE
jgi:hypothetical protein